MLSPAMIDQLNREAAAIAAAERLEPLAIDEHDVLAWQAMIDVGFPPKFPFPYLADYVPEGWDLLEEMFVDSSGWDLHDAGGPAMSVAEFVEALEPGCGYAITSAGQFQVYVGKYVEIDG